MKIKFVWTLLKEQRPDQETILGVFSTKKKAENYADKHQKEFNQSPIHFIIEEGILDEKYNNKDFDEE